MKKRMLDYVKEILQKVSFDLALFEKELRKSINSYLLPNEVECLKEWCYKHFYHSERHAEVIDGCFELLPDNQGFMN
jgi:hypothetical protein